MFYKCFFIAIFITVFSVLFIKYHVVNSNPHEEALSCVTDLVVSTHLIRQLIKQDSLKTVLEDHDPEELSVLLDNFSPAAMAFESEVLTTTIPLVVVCYCNKNDEKYELLMQQLENLAFKYAEAIKFVCVDVERLFSLAHNAEIETTPTIVIIKNREEIDRTEEIDSLEDILALYF